MDKRSLLLGLGIGIIIGALLMQLFMMGEQSSKQLEEMDNIINTIQSPEETPVEQSVDVNNEDSDVQPSTEANEQLEKQIDAELEEGNSSAPTSSSSNDSDLTTPTLNDESEGVTTASKTVILRIYTGATVTETADVLAAHNIIQNNSEFTTYTKQKRKRIRAGYFLVNEQSTNEEILKILTSTPITEENAIELQKKERYDIIFSPER